MKTQENKQKAIELAYGSLYEKYKESINSDGYVRFGGKSSEEFIELNTRSDFEKKEWIGFYFFRPKSLSGIEDNNGWISINSEEDLPRENMQCFIVQNGNVQIGSYISNYKRWFAPGCYYSETYKNLGITHYQRIEKPKKPIY